MKWIAKVGTNILKKKGINIYDYVNDLVDLAIPLDQLGLLILARTYHRHITVFCKDYVWTTRSDNAMRDCTAYLVYKGGVNFIDSVPDNVVPSKKDSLKIVGSTPVKTPRNKRKTVSANRIITKRRKRTETDTDTDTVFRSGFAERQTRNSKREKCRVSLDKVLQQYRSSNRKKKNTKSSDHEIATAVKRSRSTDVSSLDACNYDKFVAGDGTEQPAKEDLDVENNNVLPTTSCDNGQSSPKGDGTQSHVTEDINVENNSVLPQAEGHQGETTPNQVDIQLRDKGDSTPNGNGMQVPDKGDSNQNGHKAD